jgi:hypothetical protein
MLSIILSRSVSFIAKIGGSLAAQSGSPRFKMADAARLSIPSFVHTCGLPVAQIRKEKAL